MDQHVRQPHGQPFCDALTTYGFRYHFDLTEVLQSEFQAQI
jgi:hypothetical protein